MLVEQERKEAAGEAPRRAYERLLLDAINGHQAHFVRGDELEAAWAIVDPINAAIDNGLVPLRWGGREGRRGFGRGYNTVKYKVVFFPSLVNDELTCMRRKTEYGISSQT